MKKWFTTFPWEKEGERRKEKRKQISLTNENLIHICELQTSMVCEIPGEYCCIRRSVLFLDLCCFQDVKLLSRNAMEEQVSEKKHRGVLKQNK